MASCLPSAEVYERLQQARDHAEQLDILHDQYADACLAYARRYARSRPCPLVTPEDLVQELFVKIAARQSLHRYEVRRAWLLCCLKNLAIDLSRKHRPRPLPFDPTLEAEAVDAFDLALFEKQLHAQLAALRRELSSGPEGEPDPCKEAIFEEWVDGILARPPRDEALRSPCGDITAGHMRVKRHRLYKKWSGQLVTWLRQDFGIERLQEWQAALRRSADARHDDSSSSGRSGAGARQHP
jgi:DNA-directed RNA polymerase specialized sigma24 family protein